ncbi:hypothetical protein EVAR_56644_1 [Eumeta japonica]|uniref:Uncharacterized protein n=1 Tax=Eumeta variegata TaxID=151549 RepID=A0A4C1YWK6_EUMVA|nr:hypothetical protein EVAR_56644_1 [Eumeta japonica]
MLWGANVSAGAGTEIRTGYEKLKKLTSFSILHSASCRQKMRKDYHQHSIDCGASVAAAEISSAAGAGPAKVFTTKAITFSIQFIQTHNYVTRKLKRVPIHQTLSTHDGDAVDGGPGRALGAKISRVRQEIYACSADLVPCEQMDTTLPEKRTAAEVFGYTL